MGCNVYEVNAWAGGGWKSIHIARDYDSDWCADECTFLGDEPVTVARLRTFAALGAALVLAHNGVLTDDYEYAPGSLPDSVREAIDRLLPWDGTEA